MNMQLIKKTGITLLGVLCFSVINCGCYALRTQTPANQPFVGDSSPSIDNEKIEKIDEGSYTFTNKLEGILKPYERDHYETTLGYVTSLIQIIINWTVGMLSTVALVYMLYCGFLIFTSGADDKNASKGKKGLSTAAVALAGVGISWLIISAMIWFINLISATK